MKQIIFVVSLLIAGACALTLIDEVTNQVADILSLTKLDVETCMNKTNVFTTDLMKIEGVGFDDLTNPDSEKSVLKVTCLFVCLLQKKEIMSGKHFNLENLKKVIDTQIHPSALKNPTYIEKRDHIVDMCNNRVRNKSNECEVLLKFYMCIVKEFTQAAL